MKIQSGSPKTVDFISGLLLSELENGNLHDQGTDSLIEQIRSMIANGDIGCLLPYINAQYMSRMVLGSLRRQGGARTKACFLFIFLGSATDRLLRKAKLRLWNCGFSVLNWLHWRLIRNQAFDVHVRVFPGIGNAGDRVLFALVAKQLKILTPRPIINVDFRSPPEPSTEAILRNSTVIWAGGGGLIDVLAPNSLALQWSPISAGKDYSNKTYWLSIGYNLFMGESLSIEQELYLKSIFENSPFVGLRNKGSIEAIARITSKTDNLVLRPCPTTFMSSSNQATRRQRRDVLANIAGDRIHKRYDDPFLVFDVLSHIAEWLKHKDIALKIVFHTEDDLVVKRLFDRHNIPTISLISASVNRIIDVYGNASCVIATRGHSQMIAFGCNTPMITYVTHPKARFFAEDMGLLDTVVTPQQFTVEHLCSLISCLHSVPPDYTSKQSLLHEITEASDKKIRDLFL